MTDSQKALLQNYLDEAYRIKKQIEEANLDLKTLRESAKETCGVSHGEFNTLLSQLIILAKGE